MRTGPLQDRPAVRGLWETGVILIPWRYFSVGVRISGAAKLRNCPVPWLARSSGGQLPPPGFGISITGYAKAVGGGRDGRGGDRFGTYQLCTQVTSKSES